MEPDIRGWRRYTLIGPPMILLFFAQAMSGTVLTDLIAYRTCQMILRFNDTCIVLHENSSSKAALEIETQIEPYVGTILIIKSLIESVLPAFLSLFFGPWSDKHGRKPLLLLGFTGFSVMFLILSLMCTWNMNPWLLLVAFIPSSLLGGFCILILASICYISDISDNNDRAWQLAWLQASLSIGLLFGIFVGPVIYEKYGYTTVFGIATVCCVLAGLYVLLYVPETIQNQCTETACSMFNLALVKELFVTCIKKQDGFNRGIVWCGMMVLVLNVLIVEGESTVGFLFARERLSWDISKYSMYMGTSMILGIIGTLFSVKVAGNYVGISDSSLAALSTISALGGAIMKAVTWQSWHMYLSVGIGMFGGVCGPVIRAILSKSIPSRNIGKVFSLTSSMETVTPLGAAPLYTLIYTHYLPPLYPSPVWLVSATFYIITLLIVIYIAKHITRSISDETPLLVE